MNMQTTVASLGFFSRCANTQAHGLHFAKVVGGNYNQSGNVSLQICECFSSILALGNIRLFCKMLNVPVD